MKQFLAKIFPTKSDLSTSRGSLLLCFVSGLTGGLLFQQNWLGLLGWIALIPYFVAVHHLRGKMLFWATMLFGFTWYYLGLFWLHTLIVFSWLIPIGVLVGVIYISLYFLLFAYPASWICRRIPPVFRPWMIAICWTAVEYLRSFTDMAFPWNLLGHSQAPAFPAIMHLASYGGVYLVTFLMVLVNASVTELIVSRSAIGLPTVPLARRIITAVIPLAFVTLILIFFGQWTITPKRVGDKIKVAVIQPGTSQMARWNATMGLPDDTPEQYQRRYYETDSEMQAAVGTLITEAARQHHPRLIVLPESTFLTSYFPYETQLHNDLTSLSKSLEADLFFGADNRIEREIYDKMAADGQKFLGANDIPSTAPLPVLPMLITDNGTSYPDMSREPPIAQTVAAWHVSAQTGLDHRVYNKMQLVPFGETVPFIANYEGLMDSLEASGIAGRLKPGMQNTVFETGGARFGAVICFESTFSYLTRHLAEAGCQFICVLTNDSWYDPKYAMDNGGFWGTLFKIPGIHQLAAAGPRQHFIQSQFRSVETGLPIVRSASTGISALIDRNGFVEDELPYSQGGFLSGDVKLNASYKPTLSVRFGEWVGLICLGGWLAITITMIANVFRHRQN